MIIELKMEEMTKNMYRKSRIAKSQSLRSLLIVIFLTITVHLASNSQANNLSISNVVLADRSPSSQNVVVKFDLSWENSWKTKINHDAVWLTVRLHDPAVVPTEKKLCQMNLEGSNPVGTSISDDSELEIFIPQDKMGAFVRPSSFGQNSIISASDVNLTIDYSSCGFSNNDEVIASINGLEMVLIPEGSFYVGDNDTSTASLHQGSGDSDSWYIASSNAIGVSNAVIDGFRYVSAGNSGEDVTGSTMSIPESFPKGYGSFYAMKYEITEGQWVNFVNSLSSAARESRDITDNLHKNSDAVIDRNTVSCSGSPINCSSQRPARAVSFLNWMDFAAFLDWQALRPMTELEFEKMARGPVLAVNGEFVWGSTNITAASLISDGDEEGSETILTSNANANYNSSILTGGDADNGVDYNQGTLRTGIFATSSSDRTNSGAGYYGVLDLSGNVSERVVTIGNVFGRLFEGAHGDGVLSSSSGYEGNADEEDWPGIDAIIQRGVTSSEGSGFRGGAWDSLESRLRISDRSDAANSSASAASNSGGRGVRSYVE